MTVIYKTSQLQKLTDNSYLKSNFSKGVAKNIESFLDISRAAPNLFFMQSTYRGMRIEKLKGKTQTYSARIDKNYRIEFLVTEEKIIEIIVIEISKIHKHKYK